MDIIRQSARLLVAPGSAALYSVLILGCPARELPNDTGTSAECCGGQGLCLPTSFLDGQAKRLLGPDTCNGGLMCVPHELRRGEIPSSCRASSTGGEGRCLADCLPGVRQRGNQLAVDGCEPNERCVPCYDPISGESTQACDIAGDHAAQAPATFASCCESSGRCVPSGLVPDSQRALLGRDSCSAADNLCAPLEALTKGDTFVPASCTTLGFQTEGRCAPACLPQVAAQRERLGQASCAEHQLCAPCFDPLTGKSTGSCGLGADPGPSSSPVPLAGCCHGLGHCIPAQLTTSAESAQLTRESCTGTATLCVPDPLLASDFTPIACNVSGAGGAEGRCLPDCLAQVAEQSARLKSDSCPAHHLCTPCVDPITGKSTGACTQGKDKGPTRPALQFDSCCGGQSRCVPSSSVPDAQRSLLGRDSCAAAEDLCVPSAIASDPSYVPARCTVSDLQAEGRCLLRCLPPVAARGSALKQDGCAAEHACVPCADPVTGAPTGACTLPGDPGPSRPPSTLPTCCGALGRCAPASWLAQDQASNFGLDSCNDSKTLCVAPTDLLSNPQFVPDGCRDSINAAEGRCLPSCLPAVRSRARFLDRGSCPEANVCAPCFDPISGTPSGACNFPADPGPREKPVVFETCCGSSPTTATGLCVPSRLIPEGAPDLPVQTCTARDSVCAPRTLVNDPDAKFPTCTSLSVSKGVCIETCYLPSLAQAVSFAGSCTAGQLCVDCSLLGNSIGGCAP